MYLYPSTVKCHSSIIGGANTHFNGNSNEKAAYFTHFHLLDFIGWDGTRKMAAGNFEE